MRAQAPSSRRATTADAREAFWISSATAAREYDFPSVEAFRKWAYRKGLVAVNRRYCRRDIELLFSSPAREAAVKVLSRRVG